MMSEYKNGSWWQEGTVQYYNTMVNPSRSRLHANIHGVNELTFQCDLRGSLAGQWLERATDDREVAG